MRRGRNLSRGPPALVRVTSYLLRQGPLEPSPTRYSQQTRLLDSFLGPYPLGFAGLVQQPGLFEGQANRNWCKQDGDRLVFSKFVHMTREGRLDISENYPNYTVIPFWNCLFAFETGWLQTAM